MRRQIRNRLFGLADSLQEANLTIFRYLVNGRRDQVFELLGQCQEAAIQIGNVIEQQADSAEAVSLLEQYCEYAYQVTLLLDSSYDSNRIYHVLESMVSGIRCCMARDLPEGKLEVAFFPYKISMWDSLESVWEAAHRDLDCNVSVVPIPYFDWNHDGSLGAMHYEGNLFPSSVHVTSWEEYRVEDIRPDIIYIHNPYDDKNLVTTVHPDFYARRLRGFTDLLVYIPYFVCDKNVPRHFCICPGTVFSNRIILQSEEVCDIYINEFRENERKSGHQGCLEAAEKRFMPLGSPKFDKVYEVTCSPLPIPQNWEGWIMKPDGGRRKVVLYNTSLSVLLNGGEKVLKKLEFVFRFFQERKDEIVLLWRPHPLSLATYQSMRPQLLGRYRRLVDRFREERIGIFDESADPYLAISISDAYYGDAGSMKVMYQNTSKPSLVQNINLYRCIDDSEWIQFEDIWVEGDEFWCVSSNFNSLFKINCINHHIQWMGAIPGERIRGHRLYVSVVRHGDSLYLAPGTAEQIAVYNLSDGRFDKIPINEHVGDDGDIKFNSIIIDGHFLFFFPNRYPAVIRYDAESGKTDYFGSWRAEADKKVKGMGFIGKAIRVGDWVIHAFNGWNGGLAFHLKTCEARIIRIGDYVNGYCGIIYDGWSCWLLPKSLEKKGFVRWNPDTGECHVVSWDIPGYVAGGGTPFGPAVCWGGYIWVFPGTGNMVLKINIEDESIKDVVDLQGLYLPWDADQSFFRSCIMAKVQDGRMLLSGGRNRRFIEYEVDKGSCEMMYLKTPAKVRSFIKNEKDTVVWRKNMRETASYSLEAYMEDILSPNQVRTGIHEEEEPSGNRIHKMMKQTLIEKGTD